MSRPADDERVPRLPRGRVFKLSGPALFRIATTLLLLVAILAMRRPCADAASKFVNSFGDQGSASSAVPKPGTVDIPAATGSDGFEHVGSNATADEVRAAWERARSKVKPEAGGGGASGGGTGSAAGSASASASGGGSGR